MALGTLSKTPSLPHRCSLIGGKPVQPALHPRTWWLPRHRRGKETWSVTSWSFLICLLDRFFLLSVWGSLIGTSSPYTFNIITNLLGFISTSYFMLFVLSILSFSISLPLFKLVWFLLFHTTKYRRYILSFYVFII